MQGSGRPGLCACGLPQHFASDQVRDQVQRAIREHGPELPLWIKGNVYLGPPDLDRLPPGDDAGRRLALWVSSRGGCRLRGRRFLDVEPPRVQAARVSSQALAAWCWLRRPPGTSQPVVWTTYLVHAVAIFFILSPLIVSYPGVPAGVISAIGAITVVLNQLGYQSHCTTV